jgi:hypothetical protein
MVTYEEDEAGNSEGYDGLEVLDLLVLNKPNHQREM